MRISVCLSSFLLAGLALYWSVWAESPAPSEAAAPATDVVPVTDLVAEAENKVESLAEHTADEEAFEKAREEMLARHAGLLACLAQAIIEHPDRGRVQRSPVALRTAALELRASESLEGAREALARARAALEEGTSDAAAVESASAIDWQDLIDMDSLMAEVNFHHNRLRFFQRRIRNPETDSLYASTAAVLATAMGAWSDYAIDDEDAARWKAWSADYGRHMTALSAAIKARDADLVNTHYTAGAKTCTDCHEAFRVDD